MVRRQKLISMTDRHFEVAQEMGNFSKWVREQLDKHIQKTENGQEDEKEYHCKGCNSTLYLNRVQCRLRGNYWAAIRWCHTCDSETLTRVI
jgi:RNase P subunit RPR2